MVTQSNQTQIPVIQTMDASLTQIQQNANKVLRNIYNQLNVLQILLTEIQGIGDILLSPLTLSQFQSAHSPNWIEANGQSCVGTAYESFTSNKVVPTVTVAGTNAYIKVN